MAIRVRCKCGKSLKISSKLADKKIACPECKHSFRIPAEKFAAMAGPAAPVPAAPPATPIDPMPASLDDEIAAAGSGMIEFTQSDALLDLIGEPAPGEAAPTALTLEELPAEVGYATDPTARIQGARRPSDPISGPQRGFFADVLTSFIYPVKSVNNLVTLAIIFVVSAIGDATSQMQMGLLGLFVRLACALIIGGWFASLYFAVIQETATGSEDLPGLTLEDGWFDGVIVPAFRYIGAIALVLLPAIGLTFFNAMGWIPSSVASLIPIWFFGGVFLLPMSMMLFSFRSASTMFRIDLVLATIAKTILPYLSIWGILLLVSFVIVLAKGGASVLGTLIGVSMTSMSPTAFLGGLLGRVILSWIGVYFTLVGMRTIGLYYLHFKRRFVFVME